MAWVRLPRFSDRHVSSGDATLTHGDPWLRRDVRKAMLRKVERLTLACAVRSEGDKHRGHGSLFAALNLLDLDDGEHACAVTRAPHLHTFVL